MKTIDLTQPGGLPLTQNVLDQMQTAYKDMFTAVISMGADVANINTTPILLSGMKRTLSVGGTISAGYFWYNGEIIKFTEGTVPVPTGGQELQIIISTSSSPLGLAFENGTTPNIIKETSATLTAAAVATNNDTRFKYADLVPFHKFFGQNKGNVNWTAASNASIGYYRKYLSNSIDISLTLNSPTDLTTTHEWRVEGTLPTGLFPPNAYWFTAIVQIIDSPTQYPGGTELITHIGGYVDNSGQIWMHWRRPLTGSYRIGATFTMPLN